MVVSQFLQKANSFYDKLNVFYIRAFHVDECLLCSYSLRTSVCGREREKERKAGCVRVRGQVLVAVGESSLPLHDSLRQH